MEKKWLNYINLAIGSLIGLFLLGALSYMMLRPREIPINTEVHIKRNLPINPFKQAQEAYDTLSNTILHLKYSPLTMQLPDLRKYLIFYGKNDRPDAKDARPVLHFAFTGNKNVTSAPPGEKMFVLYDRSVNPPQYIFSPGNEETPLWIQATSTDKEAHVKVAMKNDEGQIIQDPWSHAQFTVPQKEFVRSGTPWEIGKWRVDGSLLARQKARWYGPDKFFENHGGKEYAQEVGKQRIDFGEGENAYSVFLGPNEGLIWDSEKWKVAKPGVDSLGYPLLVIKKIEDRLMQLELWDVNGQAKISLNLLKSMEPWMPQNVLQNFKFMGSRTRSQFVFEVNKERMLLSPKDWLVQTPSGWKKLNTAQEVDDYVDRKIVGVLFVFDGIVKKGDQQFIMGTLYNSSRSDAKPVEIPIAPSPIGRRTPEDSKLKDDQQLQMPMPRGDFSTPPDVNYSIPVPQLALPKKFEQEKAMQQLEYESR